MKSFLKFSAALAAVFYAASVASANQIAYDGFAYSTPALVGNSGGTGFGSNSWAAVAGQTDPALASGSLSYTSGSKSIETTGNRVAPTNTSRATRNFASPIAVAGQTLWVSFRMNYTGALPFPTNHAGFSLFSGVDGTGTELFLGKAGSATNWGVDTSTQSAAQASGSVTTADKNAFLVTKLTYGGSNATVQMWVNPALDESSLGTAPINSTEAIFNFTSMRVSTGTNATGFEFDEFRIGQSFTDVVPEPASLGAVGCFAAGLLASRRRRT